MKIRKNNIMPIVFLTTKSEDFEKLQGFTSEANDYITKLFNASELIARVQLQLKQCRELDTKYE